jgi:hypothetical protein
MVDRQESAQSLALQGLAWLAQDADRLGAFMATGGLDPANLKERMGDPLLLAAVLDFLLAEETLLLAFCAETGVPPETPMRARAALPGGEMPNWT